ncbi:cellulose binding domain-containing protein [Actinoallomurus sp. CA-150999]|uniref:cellulose binding domain-containing protein n=1 Tax=Actinoallomurus sp. CA-150999 TaxID=3239887 RepID=UPI003D916777
MTGPANPRSTTSQRLSWPYGVIPAVLGAVLLVVSLAFGVPGARSASAAPPCAVAYSLNQWTGGFTAQVAVTNNAAPVTSWTLTWTFAGDQKVTSAWNAQVTQSGQAVTAHDSGYNGALGTGGSTTFGFQATVGGQNAVPGDFALNGARCDGDGTPTPTPTPTQPTTPTSCPQAAFCDGFEGQTGTTPSGAWQPSYPDCQGTGTVAVDHTQAHTGSTSLRVDGGATYCDHAFAVNTTGVAAAGSVIYVRYYVRHTQPLPAGHVAFTTLTDSADGGKHLRLGGQNQALQWNRESDDATLPEQSPAGVAMSVPLPVNQWSCLEFAINGTNGTMSTWLNGTEVAGLHLDGTPTPDVDRQWLSRANWRPHPTDLRLGWESYGGARDTLWFDDVAVGSSRIGC